MSVHTGQSRLTAAIPAGGTERVGYSAPGRWVPPHSADPRLEGFRL